jgi:hypothetical protein
MDTEAQIRFQIAKRRPVSDQTEVGVVPGVTKNRPHHCQARKVKFIPKGCKHRVCCGRGTLLNQNGLEPTSVLPPPSRSQ